MYPCEYCLKMYKYQKSLENHQKICQKHKCEYCGKLYKHKTNYYRHRKECTKKKPEESEPMVNAEIMKQMMDLLKHSMDQNGNNTTNNNINSNNNSNNKEINIHINNFGAEPPLDLSYEDWRKLGLSHNIILELAMRKHINLKENRNVYFRDKDLEALYYHQGNWNKANKYVLANDIVLDQINTIENAQNSYDFTKDKSYDRHITLSNKFAYIIDVLGSDRTKRLDIEKDVIRSFENQSDLIKESIKMTK